MHEFTEKDLPNLKDKREVYSSGALLEDSKLLGNFDELLSCLTEEPLLDASTCQFEKYYDKKKDPKYVPPSLLTGWAKNSEFDIVETTLGTRFSILVCDDCENEWADFIGIGKNEIEFFACKYKNCDKDGSCSASYFQDVVGQAIKNLENFVPTEVQLNAKIGEWEANYQSNPNIPRIVKGQKGDLEKFWNAGMASPYFTKTSSLVVNFLSKSVFENKIKELKDIEEKKSKKEMSYKEPVYQQLQILSTFVHACKELGIVPKIYCRE